MTATVGKLGEAANIVKSYTGNMMVLPGARSPSKIAAETAVIGGSSSQIGLRWAGNSILRERAQF